MSNNALVPEKQPVGGENPPNPEPHKKLRAEIFFDKAVYGGISYFTQALTGILLTHSIKYGKLQKPFNNFVQWITGKTLTKGASTTAMVTTMVMVGNAFILPVKWLENRKPKIVRWINDKMNARHEPTPEERAEQEKSLHYLEHHAPKQSWTSLLIGRAFGLAPVFGIDYLLGEERNVFLQKKSAEIIQKGFGAVGLKTLSKSKMTEEYIRIGFIDAFYSAIAAGGLYVYSHLLHPHKKPKAQAGEAVVTESAPPVATPSADAPRAEKRFAAQHPAKARSDWQTSVSNFDTETTGIAPIL